MWHQIEDKTVVFTQLQSREGGASAAISDNKSNPRDEPHFLLETFLTK